MGAGVWAAAALVSILEAAAHGPAPSPLGVVAWHDEDRTCGVSAAPAVIRTNIGLAIRDGADTVYGCPSRWGDEETPLVARGSGDSLIVAGATDAWFVADWREDRACAVQPIRLPDEAVVMGLRSGDPAWMVITGASITEIGRVDADGFTPWTTRPGRPSGFAARGEQAVTAIGTELIVVSEGQDGRPVVDTIPTVDSDGLPIAFRVTSMGASRVFGTWGDGESRTIGWIGADGVATRMPDTPVGAEGILGPMAQPEDAAWVVADRVVYATWAAPLFADRITWIGEDRLVFGTLGDVRVGWPGQDEVVFEMDLLGPPDAACPDPAGTCALDWAHFGGESGWVLTAPGTCPGDDRTPIPDPDADCCGLFPPETGRARACHVGGEGAPIGGIAVLALAMHRRRRRSG